MLSLLGYDLALWLLKVDFLLSFLPSEKFNLVISMDYGLGIPGDGRCLFRSVVHGASLREGKPSPSESCQKELADELRAKVADEFIRRRADTEWFLEGDFDTYVKQMRQPHMWGGEPELLMASHVLQSPITVSMWDKSSGNLKIIAEYGQEYGKENPIRVLYHGYGHYDALRSPISSAESKLAKEDHVTGLLGGPNNFYFIGTRKDEGIAAKEYSHL
uniref:Ubiquitin thioesterase OTU n=1 Tax=Quercus lobata TaxID=97700 RepID=A0A7N2R1N4_QUELO